MERCALAMKSERAWITGAVSRMRNTFEKVHLNWDRRQKANKESKQKRADEAANAETAAGEPGVPAAARKRRAATPVVEARPPRRPKFVGAVCAAADEKDAE